MTEWIKCSDQCPPSYDKEYLVTDGQKVDIYKWKQFRSLNQWNWDCRDEVCEFMNITHYMPLPEPPKD